MMSGAAEFVALTATAIMKSAGRWTFARSIYWSVCINPGSAGILACRAFARGRL